MEDFFGSPSESFVPGSAFPTGDLCNSENSGSRRVGKAMMWRLVC